MSGTAWLPPYQFTLSPTTHPITSAVTNVQIPGAHIPHPEAITGCIGTCHPPVYGVLLIGPKTQGMGQSLSRSPSSSMQESHQLCHKSSPAENWTPPVPYWPAKTNHRSSHGSSPFAPPSSMLERRSTPSYAGGALPSTTFNNGAPSEPTSRVFRRLVRSSKESGHTSTFSICVCNCS